MTSSLVLATRRSALALAQSRAFARTLELKAGVTITELQIVTSGDRFQQERLQDIGGKALFVKELEEALLAGSADLAVHSIKDVPSELPPTLALVCIPEREDPRDVLVSQGNVGLMQLRDGARVGTSSLRRAVCLKAVRPDLDIQPLRGNVDTRLRRVEEGAYDAIVLALAGLKRLGLEARASEVLDAEVCLPAVGQGALGIEAREADERTRSALAVLEDPEARILVSAERAVMAAVFGSCRLPVAAYARHLGDELVLDGLLAEADGTRLRRTKRAVPWTSDLRAAETLGRELGDALRV